MFFWNNLTAEILTWLSLLIISFVLYSKYVFSHWTRHNIPQVFRKPLLIFGHVKNSMLKRTNVANILVECYKEFKQRQIKYGGIFFSMKPVLLVNDPEMIKQIMVRDFEYFTDRGIFTDAENDPLSAHLFSIGGQKWRDLRVKLTPTFTSGKMKMMFNTLVACSDELQVILQEKERQAEPMNIKDYLARFTIDVIGSCGFGIDCNCLKNPTTDFRKYGQMFFDKKNVKEVLRSMGAFLIPNVYKFFKIKTLTPEITDFFMDVVKQTIKYREENKIDRKDFMQLLLQLKNEGKISPVNSQDHEKLTEEEEILKKLKLSEGHVNQKGLTVEEIAAQCFVFFMAGFETSSTTMTFCLYELVKNPEIQEKLREEILTVLKKYDGKLTYEGIMEMHYMEKVINETLRKYPPVPFLIRKCTKDYKLPNSHYTVRKGHNVWFPVLGIQRDPEYYPNPEQFDPERFVPEERAKRHPFTWLPFGEGPRICIGLRFGMMQTKVGLSALLKNYRFKLNEKTREPLILDPISFIMSTKGGIWLDIEKVS